MSVAMDIVSFPDTVVVDIVLLRALVEQSVICDSMPRLYRTHDLAERRARGMELTAGSPGKLRWLISKCREYSRWIEGLVDHDICVFPVLYEPFIR